MKEPPPQIPTAAQPFKSEDYLSVCSLVTLEDLRDTFDFLQRTLMAIFLLKVLQRANYFGPWDDESKLNKYCSSYLKSIL